MMTALTLNAASECDIGSICMWLYSHADEPGVPRNARTASDWLARETISVRAYPTKIAVPPVYARAFEWVIEDLSEIEASHDACFETALDAPRETACIRT